MNAYDESKNSKEIISLEIAENMLMSKELSEFLSSNMKIISNLFSYNTSSPDPSELIKGLVEFYNNSSFNSIISVEKNHIYFIFECIILLDQCFWALRDERERVLIERSSYEGFAADMMT